MSGAKRHHAPGPGSAESVNSPGPVKSGSSTVATRPRADVLAVILMLVFATGAITLSLMPVVQNELRTSD